mgnify:CR=1 FL=1
MRIDELARIMGVSRQKVEDILKSADVISLDLNERGARLSSKGDDEVFIKLA